jgi:hypothetical protein
MCKLNYLVCNIMFYTFSNENQKKDPELYYIIGTISTGVKPVVLIKLKSLKIKDWPRGARTLNLMTSSHVRCLLHQIGVCTIYIQKFIIQVTCRHVQLKYSFYRREVRCIRLTYVYYETLLTPLVKIYLLGFRPSPSDSPPKFYVEMLV